MVETVFNGMIKYALPSVIILALTFYVFPGSMWFLELWSGIAFSMFYISINEQVVLYRANSDLLNEPQASIEFAARMKGWLSILVSIVFTSSSIFVIYPTMDSEIKEKNLITNSVIESIQIKYGTEPSRFLNMPDLKVAKGLIAKTEVFYTSHEGPTIEFDLRIHTTDGLLKYEADVPERHIDDIRLRFKHSRGYSNLLVSELGKLLISRGYIE